MSAVGVLGRRHALTERDGRLGGYHHGSDNRSISEIPAERIERVARRDRPLPQRDDRRGESVDIENPELVATSKPQAKVFFPNLDGLRFFAFFVVFLSHGFGSLPKLFDFAPRLRDALFESGGLGVAFFFTLSGFLITYLILHEIAVTGTIDVRAFYIRRTLRIWPLYYLVIIFAFVVYPLIKSFLGFGSYIEAGSPLYYIFFLGNFDVIRMGQNHGAQITNITWSVAIEEQFYLCWPLLFLFIKPRFYKFIFPIIILGSLAFRFANLDRGMVLYFHTLSVISDMAVGGLGAFLAATSIRFKEFFREIPRSYILLAYGAGFLLVVLHGRLFASSVLPAFERLALSFFFVFILLEQNYCRRSPLKISQLRRISKLGSYTYGLYLLHPVALLVVNNTLRILKLDSAGIANGLFIGTVGLFVSIALSAASYHCYERKFLTLKERFAHVKSGSGYEGVKPGRLLDG